MEILRTRFASSVFHASGFGSFAPSLTVLLAAALLVWPLALQAQAHAWQIRDLGPSWTEQANESPAPVAPLWSADYGHELIRDAQAMFSAPLKWNRRDWLVAGALSGVVVASSALDGQIKEESQENRSHQLDSTSRLVQRFGAEYSFAVLGVFEGYGYLANDRRAKLVAKDGVTASILASGIATPLIKFAVGRVRPNSSRHTFEFKPFSGNYSFPSGHATQAFAVASVISAHYPQWWVQTLSYGLAAGVGYSRIEQDSHYVSDVAAGAIIGTLIGRSVVHRHAAAEHAFNFQPYLSKAGFGTVGSKDF